jgi:transposase-like protein
LSLGEELQKPARRWTAKRKMEVVLEGFRGEITPAEIARKYGITQAQYFEWRDQVLAAGMAGLRNGGDEDPRMEQLEDQVKIQRVATAAGLGRVTPHQLRHTLATQAVNRGMSLESIAAMLGHRSLEMTLVYARIANRTVEKEYFNVTRQLDQHTNIQVTIPEGPEMANLRKEMDWRRLGNGYCTRPKKMPCEYETICETCTMFMTTHEFLPTLQIQREDAERKGQVGRVRVFCDLIAKVQGA